MDSIPGVSMWAIFMNGVRGHLTIESLSNGVVIGTIGDSENVTQPLEPVSGATTPTWKQNAKQFQFARTLQDGEVQTFTGYLDDFDAAVSDDVRVDGQTPRATLAGTFTASRYEDRAEFGWFAFLLRLG
ncbi:hypothetical protein BN2475_630057 [Paraburkholderia ribeironis]|uniref:Uncharacterized protein n=1 Tax=Paraburkholderia ribeironis TaxID=1247936 RepID=A0A1N7SFQ9_9BURK|nr:hypothetical protein [Paraburkholderia ribeironis]SIT46217.1 hypothetical protein BN2475_630057 [Paraburkholderia ribeironis]